jgi:predicted Zn-dependent protease
MKQGATMSEIRNLANQLKTLKELNPEHYYEYKGRISALYEKETEKKAVSC